MWKVWCLKGFNLEKANDKQVFISLRFWTGSWALPLSVVFDRNEQRKNEYDIIISLLCLSAKITFYRPL